MEYKFLNSGIGMKIGLMQLEIIAKRIIFSLTMDMFEDISEAGTGTGTGKKI